MVAVKNYEEGKKPKRQVSNPILYQPYRCKINLYGDMCDIADEVSTQINSGQQVDMVTYTAFYGKLTKPKPKAQ